jgi:hypothetical protein
MTQEQPSGHLAGGTLVRTIALLVCAMSLSCGAKVPTEPDDTAFALTQIACFPDSATTASCRAKVLCSGGFCSDADRDVTSTATWTVDDPRIMAVVSPGRLQGLAAGDTILRAKWSTAGVIPHVMSVFPGTPPLDTTDLEGFIFEGSPTARTPLDGATIEVLEPDAIAGRTAVSGEPESVIPPGFTPFRGPDGRVPHGLYRILPVPSPPYRVRVSKDGYVTLEQDLSINVSADFYLRRQ